jgi:hypothetical protein
MKHLVVGALLSLLGLVGLISWWPTFGLVMRGVLPFTLLLFGIVGMYSGLRRISGTKNGTGSEGGEGR